MNTVIVRAFLVLMACIPFAAYSEAPEDPSADPVMQAMLESRVLGPASVPLRDLATMQIAADTAFIPRPAAEQLMNASGNRVGDEFIGVILPSGEAAWFITVNYFESGYIPDDDAREWDVAELLASLKDGAAAGNEWRKEQGFAQIEVTGWIQEPAYDATLHHLVWSAGVRDVGATSSADDSVNYNTYVLGRQGYLSLNLVTSASEVVARHPIVRDLLEATHFNAGQTYADFDSSTDDVAAYGLAALVGGIAAKKIGLIAAAAAFLVKGWKIVMVVILGLGAAMRRMFGQKNA